MKADEQRKKLHQYIDVAEEEEIDAIYSALKDIVEKPESQLTDSQKTESDNRMRNYKNDSGKAYSWNETITMAREAVSSK